MHRNLIVTLIAGLLLALSSATALAADASLAEGVRGLATRAPEKMKIDGNLEEFEHAFCTPVGYFEQDIANRAGQFLYMWDDTAFYAGLRTMDQKQANPAPDDKLWEGDAVEWYFDTRRDKNFRAHEWGPGAAHMYWTGFKGTDLKPRFCLRPDMLKAIPGTGVEVGARKTSYGTEVEFKLPWANFPDFKVKTGAVIALDAELCYSDGAGRVERTFAYGSPLSVQQPASQAKIELVDKMLPEYWKTCGPVLAPVRCDTAWNQNNAADVTGLMALPANQAETVGKVAFRLLNTDGKTIGEYPGTIETLNAEGKFYRAQANWPIDAAPPGGYLLLGIVTDKQGKELTRVAPRMLSVKTQPGY